LVGNAGSINLLIFQRDVDGSEGSRQRKKPLAFIPVALIAMSTTGCNSQVAPGCCLFFLLSPKRNK